MDFNFQIHHCVCDITKLAEVSIINQGVPELPGMWGWGGRGYPSGFQLPLHFSISEIIFSPLKY